ncbi:MAG: lipid-A-disaccharide synthase [Deltaproteobacteria bacterium]|nr:lipid-A-disaccharide synthase [Deltaproteobacteria bacterium]
MSFTDHLFISVGESSGDLMAAYLVQQLKELDPHLHFSGIVGPALLTLGVHPVAEMDELSVMGVVEVLRNLARIKMLKSKVLSYIDTHPISAAILVDSAGFHFQLAEELKMRGIKTIQYVAPKLWAWGEHRIARLKRDFDLVLSTFPFEENYFQQRGVPCYYVGCPIADRTARIQLTKEALGYAHDKHLVAALPGSRVQEVQRLLPRLKSIAQRIKDQVPDTQFVVPIQPNIRKRLKTLLENMEEENFQFTDNMSLELMAVADAAIVASGTATLECALLETPLVVVYAMSPFSYWLAKRKVKIPWVSLVNILQEKAVVREFIQHFSDESVAHELVTLLLSDSERQSMRLEFQQLKKKLSAPSSVSAVTRIGDLLGLYRKKRVYSVQDN